MVVQRDWMSAFDNAKKSNQKQSQPNQRESVSERPVSMISRGDSTESNNRILILFKSCVVIINFVLAFEEPIPDPTPEQLIPEWLTEAPDDMDVYIAQRHFEDAYNLIVRCKENWGDIPSSTKLQLLQ